MKKVIFVISTLLILMSLSVVSGCDTLGNSSLEIVVDRVFEDDEELLTTITFDNVSKDKSYTYTASNEGLISVKKIPKDDYTVTISRFGAKEIFELNINKNEYSLDYRLFYDAKGSALEGTHYIISGREELFNLNKMQNANTTVSYHLNSDIDLGNDEIVPIESFNGKLNGRAYGEIIGEGYKISNFSIIRPEEDSIGLFKENSGTIRNLIIDNASLEGREEVGAITGLNLGRIINCDVRNSSITAINYAGALVGIDRGSISLMNSNTAFSVSINSNDYYGRIAGMSFSNMTLGAYDIKPNQAGIYSIDENMSALEMFNTAIANWNSLDNRAVLHTAEIKRDVTDTAKKVIDSVKNAFKKISLERIVLDFLARNEFYALDKMDIRRVYNGSYDEGINQLLISGSGYTKSTSFDEILDGFASMPQFANFVDEIDVQFPYGFAIYYDEYDNERMEMQVSSDAYVGDDEIVSYTLEDKIYTFNIEDDIQEFASGNDVTEQSVSRMLGYVETIKRQIMNISFLDLQLEGAIKEIESEPTYNDQGYYTATMILDPDIALGYIQDNLQTFIDAETAGTTEEGTILEINHNKDIKLYFEIWENGHLKRVRMSELDVTANVFLTLETQNFLDSMANQELGVGLSLEQMTVEISGFVMDKFSYSKTDTEIDIYLSEFEKEEEKIIDVMQDYIDNELAKESEGDEG